MAEPRYSDVQERSRLAALCALGTHDNPAIAALAVIDVAHAFFNDVIGQLQLQDKVAGLACQSGCYHCCHQIVGVSLSELALLRQAIANLPAAQQKQIKARLSKTAKQGRALDQAQWWAAKIRCPLLDADGACMVHAARPLPCRAMNSADAGICRQSLDGNPLPIPILAAQHRIFGHAQTGLIQALNQFGLAAAPVNMALGLADR